MFDLILSWRVAIVVLFAALVPVSVFYAMQLKSSSAIGSLVVPDDPDYAATRAFQKVFPESQVVLLLLEFERPFEPGAIAEADAVARAARGVPGVTVFSALEIYRREFRPSPALAAPYVMVGVPAFGAETDEQAEHLATSMYQRSLGILRGKRTALQPPVRDMAALWSRAEALAVADRMALMVVGGEERLRDGFQQILDATGADELIVVSDAYDFADRLRSFDVIARAAGLPRRID